MFCIPSEGPYNSHTQISEQSPYQTWAHPSLLKPLPQWPAQQNNPSASVWLWRGASSFQLATLIHVGPPWGWRKWCHLASCRVGWSHHTEENSFETEHSWVPPTFETVDPAKSEGGGSTSGVFDSGTQGFFYVLQRLWGLSFLLGSLSHTSTLWGHKPKSLVLLGHSELLSQSLATE